MLMAPRRKYPSARFILRGQAIGFSCMLVLLWTSEFLNLPHRIFGDDPDAMWLRLSIRTPSLLIFWLIVHLTTAHLLKRLHELESYLRICSWCRKVENSGQWLTLEDYFSTRFQTDTTHGICPHCMKDQLSQHLQPGLTPAPRTKPLARRIP